MKELYFEIGRYVCLLTWASWVIAFVIHPFLRWNYCYILEKNFAVKDLIAFKLVRKLEYDHVPDSAVVRTIPAFYVVSVMGGWVGGLLLLIGWGVLAFFLGYYFLLRVLRFCFRMKKAVKKLGDHVHDHPESVKKTKV